MSDDEKPSDDPRPTASGSEDSTDPGISDDQLPDDVRPSEDNPLAYGPTDEDDEDEGMSLGGGDAPGA